MFKTIIRKIKRIAQSKTLRVALLFLFVFVITSLVEVITNFYEVKTPIVHGYFMWIMLFLFMWVILPPESSQLTNTVSHNSQDPPPTPLPPNAGDDGNLHPTTANAGSTSTANAGSTPTPTPTHNAGSDPSSPITGGGSLFKIFG